MILNSFSLPCSNNLICKENVQYINEFCSEKSIDIIINQAAISPQTVRFFNQIIKISRIKIINCIHNSILTQVYNYAAQKEFVLKQHDLSIIYRILNFKFSRSLLVQIYSAKNRTRYLNIIDNSDAVVVLCDGQKQELLKICHLKSASNVFTIPNFSQMKKDDCRDVIKNNDVLWVGTIDFTVKRIDLMLKIWKQVCFKCPNWRLKILGDGKGIHRAKEMAEILGLVNIFF